MARCLEARSLAPFRVGSKHRSQVMGTWPFMAMLDAAASIKRTGREVSCVELLPKEVREELAGIVRQ